MRIKIKKTGGFAGIEEDVGTVDTKKLGAADAQAIESQVAKLAEAHAKETAEPVGADMIRYEIVIEDEGSARTLTVVDDGDPARDSLSRITQLAAALSSSL